MDGPNSEMIDVFFSNPKHVGLLESETFEFQAIRAFRTSFTQPGEEGGFGFNMGGNCILPSTRNYNNIDSLKLNIDSQIFEDLYGWEGLLLASSGVDREIMFLVDVKSGGGSSSCVIHKILKRIESTRAFLKLCYEGKLPGPLASLVLRSFGTNWTTFSSMPQRVGCIGRPSINSELRQDALGNKFNLYRARC